MRFVAIPVEPVFCRSGYADPSAHGRRHERTGVRHEWPMRYRRPTQHLAKSFGAAQRMAAPIPNQTVGRCSTA
jgi:hypothetical protein